MGISDKRRERRIIDSRENAIKKEADLDHLLDCEDFCEELGRAGEKDLMSVKAVSSIDDEYDVRMPWVLERSLPLVSEYRRLDLQLWSLSCMQ